MDRENHWRTLLAFVAGIAVGLSCMAIAWKCYAVRSEHESKRTRAESNSAGRQTAETFVSTLRKRDVDAAYGMTSSAFTSAVTKKELADFCGHLGDYPRFRLFRLPENYVADPNEKPKEFEFPPPGSNWIGIKVVVVPSSTGWQVRSVELYPNAIQ